MTTKFSYVYTAGVAFIITGFYLRFETSLKYIAALLYSVGWFIIALVLFLKNKDFKLKHSLFSCVMISCLWLIMETCYQNQENYNSNLPLLSFSILLVYLVYIITINKNNIITMLMVSFILLISEYVLLPLQREYNIKDGIGLPLFILGNVILYNISLKNSKIIKDAIKDAIKDISNNENEMNENIKVNEDHNILIA